MGKIKTVFLGFFMAMTLLFSPTGAQAGLGVLSDGSIVGDGIEIGNRGSIASTYFKSNDSADQLCMYDPTWLLWQTMKAAPKIGLYLLLFPVTCSPTSVRNATGNMKESLSEKAAYFKGLPWWEPIFNTISKAAVNTTNKLFDASKDMCIKLLGLGLALWLAFTTLPMVSSFKEQNPADYLQKIAGTLFKGMIAAFLLNNRDWFFGYLVSPIISIAAGFVGINASSGIGAQAVVDPLHAMLDMMQTAVAEIKAAGVLLMGPLAWIGGLMFRMGFAIKILWINIDLGTGDITLFPLPNPFLPIGGCFLWGCGMLLGIVFPFRVFDALFRLGIILALSPLYIVSWVFPITRDFAKKGFTALLHIAFLFIILYVVLVMSIQVIFSAVGIDSTLPAPTVYISIMKPFINLAFLIANVITMLVATIFCIMFLGKTDELAGHFAGASFSSNTADTMAKGVASMAKKPLNTLINGKKDENGNTVKKGLKDLYRDKKTDRMRKIYSSAKTDENGRLVDAKARRAERWLNKTGQLGLSDGTRYASSAQEKQDLIAYNNGLNAKEGTAEYEKYHKRNANGQLEDKDARAAEHRLHMAGLVDEKGNVTGRLPPSFEPPASEQMIGKERIGTLKDHPDTLAKAADDILKHPEWYRQKNDGSFKNPRAQATIAMAKEAGFLNEKGQLTESGKFHVQRYDAGAKGRATREANARAKKSK